MTKDPYKIVGTETENGIKFVGEMKNMIDLKINYLSNYDTVNWGEMHYAHEGDAGFDLKAAIDKPVTVNGLCKMIEKFSCLGECDSFNNIHLVSNGFTVEIPDGYQMEIRPRSGLAFKNGISIVNSPGTIDSGFRGEIKVIIINHGFNDFVINPGDRIAQAVLMPYARANFINTNCLKISSRGEGGFGHTGV